MATFISHSPAETEALGECWGREARRGLVIGLTGDLGTGKTQWVKGLARGLGTPERVHSPTFALLNVYEGGRLPLFHLDLYRLDGPDQIIAAGLEDYFHPDGVAVVEWAERWFQPPGNTALGFDPSWRLPPLSEDTSFRWVQFQTLGETERSITYEDPGA